MYSTMYRRFSFSSMRFSFVSAIALCIPLHISPLFRPACLYLMISFPRDCTLNLYKVPTHGPPNKREAHHQQAPRSIAAAGAAIFFFIYYSSGHI